MVVWERFKMSIRACRAQRGYSQSDVAKFVGVTNKSVVDWETGKSSPTTDKAQRLVDLFEIPFNHIDFSKEGNRLPSNEERAVILARKLDPDTITIPEDVGEGV